MSLLHLEMDLELKLSTPALHVFPQFVITMFNSPYLLCSSRCCSSSGQHTPRIWRRIWKRFVIKTCKKIIHNGPSYWTRFSVMCRPAWTGSRRYCNSRRRIRSWRQSSPPSQVCNFDQLCLEFIFAALHDFLHVKYPGLPETVEPGVLAGAGAEIFTQLRLPLLLYSTLKIFCFYGT